MLTDPKTNQDVVAEYYAYYDPDGALARWDMSDSGKVENGESRAHTLSYITSLQKYGNQDFSITGSEPLSLVLSKDGNKTYVAENHTDEVKEYILQIIHMLMYQLIQAMLDQKQGTVQIQMLMKVNC